MDEQRLKRLRERIEKLDRLASDRNPNAHERAAAADAAAKLRAKLPPERTFVWPQHWRAEPKKPSPRDKIEERINYLNSISHRLKPSGQLFASDLCAQWYSKGWLSERQLQCVHTLINEAEGN
jgi:hypothetical protein